MNEDFHQSMKRALMLRELCKNHNMAIVTAIQKPNGFDMFADSKPSDFVVDPEELRRSLAATVAQKPKLTGWLNGRGYTDKFVPNPIKGTFGFLEPKICQGPIYPKELYQIGGKAIQHPVKYTIKLESVPITVKPRKLLARWTMDGQSRKRYKKQQRFAQFRIRRRKHRPFPGGALNEDLLKQ
jgi:hypothetical protein